VPEGDALAEGDERPMRRPRVLVGWRTQEAGERRGDLQLSRRQEPELLQPVGGEEVGPVDDEEHAAMALDRLGIGFRADACRRIGG